MDIGSITSAINSLKVAKDIAQALLELKSLGDVQAKVIDLQAQILSAQSSALDAQSEQFELRKRIAEIEKQLSELQVLAAERQRYELKVVAPERYAYVLKAEHRGAEPEHWLCANCFDRGEKSIMQLGPHSQYGKQYQCPRCNHTIAIELKSPSIHRDPPNWRTV
jgi:rubrerythrin